MKLCVYGGHYGSEGKGSAAEWLAKHARHVDLKTKQPDRQLVVMGENSPNSGHTCSLGKTRNLPSTAFFADMVLMGPDSAINLSVLIEDISAIAAARNGDVPDIYIHEHAALVQKDDQAAEQSDGVVKRISSTGSGSGAARALRKQYLRNEDAVIKAGMREVEMPDGNHVHIVTRSQYLAMIEDLHTEDCLFECSQGTLLDVNWGIYPYVTSRQTLPRVAIERNALAGLGFDYVGVYRTFPIRTGGPSGPTGAEEITFDEIGVEPEIASVTKRTRRVFRFSSDDFRLSINLTRPQYICFTHLDYLKIPADQPGPFLEWLASEMGGQMPFQVEGLLLSDKLGVLYNHGRQTI